jgi:uncharacterized membrane protein
MIVLIVLLLSLLIFRGIGALGVDALTTWPAATRYALATTLTVTASAHFTKMKEDLIRMVPGWVAWPRAVVYLTGLCELAGAVGLLIPSLRLAAGIALIVFFILVFPANVKAAQSGVGLGGKPPTPLSLRLPMQLLFIVLTFWSAVWSRG